MEADIRNALLAANGSNAMDLARAYCRATVTDEIGEMIYDDLADTAFLAALKIEDYELANLAARAVVNSESYSEEATGRAKAYLDGK